MVLPQPCRPTTMHTARRRSQPRTSHSGFVGVTSAASVVTIRGPVSHGASSSASKPSRQRDSRRGRLDLTHPVSAPESHRWAIPSSENLRQLLHAGRRQLVTSEPCGVLTLLDRRQLAQGRRVELIDQQFQSQHESPAGPQDDKASSWRSRRTAAVGTRIRLPTRMLGDFTCSDSLVCGASAQVEKLSELFDRDRRPFGRVRNLHGTPYLSTAPAVKVWNHTEGSIPGIW